MLVGPNTTADQVKAKITELSKKASRLPRASDDWVRHHADIYRLQGVLDGMLKRDAELERPESATQRNLTADPDEPFKPTRRSRFFSDGQ